jgi:hypothetical protein
MLLALRLLLLARIRGRILLDFSTAPEENGGGGNPERGAMQHLLASAGGGVSVGAVAGPALRSQLHPPPTARLPRGACSPLQPALPCLPSAAAPKSSLSACPAASLLRHPANPRAAGVPQAGAVRGFSLQGVQAPFGWLQAPGFQGLVSCCSGQPRATAPNWSPPCWG